MRDSIKEGPACVIPWRRPPVPLSMTSTQPNKDGNCCRGRGANQRRQQRAPKLAAPEHYKQRSESNARGDHHCQGPWRQKEQDQNGYHNKNIISVLYYLHIQFSVRCLIRRNKITPGALTGAISVVTSPDIGLADTHTRTEKT